MCQGEKKGHILFLEKNTIMHIDLYGQKKCVHVINAFLAGKCLDHKQKNFM